MQFLNVIFFIKKFLPMAIALVLFWNRKIILMINIAMGSCISSTSVTMKPSGLILCLLFTHRVFYRT